MKFILVALASLLPAVAYSIGESGDSDWPKGARIEVGLHLSAAVGTNGQVKVSGDLLIKNSSDTPLTIQSPQNRRVLAFLVFDPLGNPVAPIGFGKADPGFETHSLSPRSTHTYHFETLDFITGSALFKYDLSPGKTYRVLAVYRPAGPNGPGFASQEISLRPGSFCQTLYDQWHKALLTHSALTEPMGFSTNGPTDLAAVVSQIEGNKIAMAYFLCEKIASEGKAGYPDALLLDKVAGIDLLRASDTPVMYQDFGTNLARFSAQFAKDWREGVYKDPSARIAQLLESKLQKRDGKSISPLDLAGPVTYDPVYHWIDRPDKRDPGLHLVFVEVVGVADEHYAFTNAANSKVSDDGGKTWYNLLKVRSGIVTLKVIESPGVEMPKTVTVHFEIARYVPTRETPWVDRRVVPGNRLLGFFRKDGDRWGLETSSFIAPLDYLLVPSRAGSLQSLFKTEPATKDSMEARRKELDAAAQRARERAATNSFDAQ